MLRGIGELQAMQHQHGRDADWAEMQRRGVFTPRAGGSQETTSEEGLLEHQQSTLEKLTNLWSSALRARLVEFLCGWKCVALLARTMPSQLACLSLFRERGSSQKGTRIWRRDVAELICSYFEVGQCAGCRRRCIVLCANCRACWCDQCQA